MADENAESKSKSGKHMFSRVIYFGCQAQFPLAKNVPICACEHCQIGLSFTKYVFPDT
jgi:hypothetical protein